MRASGTLLALVVFLPPLPRLLPQPLDLLQHLGLDDQPPPLQHVQQGLRNREGVAGFGEVVSPGLAPMPQVK